MKRLLSSILILGLLIAAGCTPEEAVYIRDNPPIAVNVTSGISGSVSATIVSPTDPLNGSIRTIQLEHAEIHEGHSYTVSDTVASSTNTTKWMISTPPGTTYDHLVFTLTCTGEALFKVTGEADRVGGTPLSVVNRRRVGTPEVSSTNVTRLPTGGTTDGATTLFSMRNGITGTGGKSVETAQARATSEWILKPATKYIISITTYVNDVYVTCILDWYSMEE